jgi:negative regulator of flagellin synthesis FlgM
MSFTNEIGRIQRSIDSVSETVNNPIAQAKQSAQSVEGNGSTAERVDVTSVSSTGGLVAKALEQPDAPSPRVAALQKAIAAGDYNVSSSDVAEKIVQDLSK